MSRHSNFKLLMDTYYPLCCNGSKCVNCELYIDGTTPDSNNCCFYKICLDAVGESINRKYANTHSHVTPAQFLNIFEEMLCACPNIVKHACEENQSCSNCVFHKFIKLIGTGCNHESVIDFMKKNLVNWHGD